jgi:hypothetical protein
MQCFGKLSTGSDVLPSVDANGAGNSRHGRWKSVAVLSPLRLPPAPNANAAAATCVIAGCVGFLRRKMRQCRSLRGTGGGV